MTIVQALRDLQNEQGYLPDADLRALALRFGVPLARIEEVTSFFPAFRLERDKPATVEVRVCRDMTCHLRGADRLISAGRKQADGERVRVEGVSCLGRCDRAPVAWVECEQMPADEHAWVYALGGKDFPELVKALAAGQSPPHDSDADYPPNTKLTADGKPEPWEIDVYGRQGWPRDYRAVQKFVALLIEKRRRAIPRPPQGTKDEVAKYVQANHPMLWRLSDAKLGGMGGALASVYQKWFDVWEQRTAADDQPEQTLGDAKAELFGKYVIANGDESEPGTFKDREIMLRLPHLIVEGVILAGLMVGAEEGYIFVRHEYHEQIDALRAEVRRAESLGACGRNVLGSGRAFPVTVFESPGGYICGEQSALIEAMEDRRGQPRNKPPEITANGFRDRPTVLNNVETLAWIPHVMLAGDDKPTYPTLGWRAPKIDGLPSAPPRFGGRRLFSISGDVVRPGVYEVPIGLPFGELIDGEEYCGGILGDQDFKAVASSGPSGGFLPALLPIPTRVREKFNKQRADLRANPPERLTFGDWFVLAHLTDTSEHVDLRRLPLDKAAFDWLKSSGVAPLAPLLGAGIAIYADGTDMLAQAVNFSRFFANESCGKCVPCRIGTTKLVQLGTDLMSKRSAGTFAPGELTQAEGDVGELTLALSQTSICSLGGSAPAPLATALAYFRSEVRGFGDGSASGSMSGGRKKE